VRSGAWWHRSQSCKWLAALAQDWQDKQHKRLEQELSGKLRQQLAGQWHRLELRRFPVSFVALGQRPAGSQQQPRSRNELNRQCSQCLSSQQRRQPHRRLQNNKWHKQPRRRLQSSQQLKQQQRHLKRLAA
jgi:hypothetical protein